MSFQTPRLALIGSLVCVGICCAQTKPVDERFDRLTEEIPDFQRHVIPLLGRLGCNGRSCHGSFQGQGDFQLSLFGYDFPMDHRRLVASATRGGRRVDPENVGRSLILKKPTLRIDHEGGQRFKVDSWEHRLLEQWIKAGAKGSDKPRELSRLEIEPAEIVFDSTDEPGRAAQLRVVAVWNDDHREDVTPLCRFRSNNDSVAKVDQDGQVTSVGSGDTHVVAFYDNGVASVPAIRPYPSIDGVEFEPQYDSEIDRLVIEKLKKLRISPSKVSTDAEFLRKVSIDLTGTLPLPSEIVSFLADPSSDKRERKIDELLDRPAYAAWWTNKLCDFTGCNPNQQAELGQETSTQWYMWIYSRLRENRPYDEIVRQIVLAKSREEGQTYEQYAAEFSSYFRDPSKTNLPPSDFATRETMPHYWTRRSMQQPTEAAEAFAHNFLGIRLQCAQCHKHPFAPWTQNDYLQFSRFFERVKFGVRAEERILYRQIAGRIGMQVRGDDGTPVRSDVLRHARKGQTIPWRELYIEPTSEDQALSLLRSGDVVIDKHTDPRLPIVRWMTNEDNPWFARAFVNRVWASYFHIGIVDPPDDMNPANPPSHPKLLDWLAMGFIESGYDMRWLHREILSSETYQRSWTPSENNADDTHNFSRTVPRRLPAEVVYDAVKQSLAATDQSSEVRTDLTRRASGHLSMRLAGTYAMQVFGKPDRAVNCDCERDNQPTLLQSVFLQNDPLIQQRLEQSGWLAEVEADGATDTKQLVRQAWLRTVNRPPTDRETERSIAHVMNADSQMKGLRDLMWALMNTKEYLLIK